MKNLYESILDNEDEIIDRMSSDIIKNQIINTLGKYTNYPIKFDKEKISINALTIRNPGLKKLLNSQNLELYKIENLDLFDEDLINWKYNFHIQYLSLLRTDSDAAKQLYLNNALKIDYLNKVDILIKNTDNDWNKLFKIIHPKELRISKTPYFSPNQLKILVNNIKNINVETLILPVGIFAERKESANISKFILTEKNIQQLDYLFNENEFKTLYIINYNTSIHKYKIIKSSRSKLGYKLIHER